MANTNALFNEADTNRDGYLTEDEFRNFVTRNSTAGLGGSSFSVTENYNSLGTSNSYDTSVFQSSATGGNVDGDLVYNGGVFERSNSSVSSFQSPSVNVRDSIANVNVTGTEQFTGSDAAYLSATSSSQTSTVQQYETDAQGNFKDSNPQIIRRPPQNGPLTYQQNIQVRFLRPPPVPPPGPLIIKEVRPPQPPAPPPLRIRQQAPPLPTPPSLVLRERPPPKPAAVSAETITKTLPPIPVPPRSVIIERIPPTPAKPRDIIIERWIPYGEMAKRKTIVQHAAAVQPYPKPRNVIIEYEVPQVRIVRQFQRLGVTPENPDEYVRRYGASLVDTQTLLQQARAAGVVEDISVTNLSVSNATSRSEVSSSPSISGASFDASNIDGLDVKGVVAGSGGNRASFYQSSYSSTGDVSGLSTGVGGFLPASTDSFSYRSATSRVPDKTGTLFAAADTNNDGALSLAEFRNAGF